ncbi:Cw-type zinc finger [Thalictrum thalictroides]|uniref:Cw-type zinc finger n=1 Tax=Thalictrum thalictroides TaxID=46969 RepID=A0A7J6WEG3_THATH|nr:Cw-type zinc finger [Thalictrum thalictroides]
MESIIRKGHVNTLSKPTTGSHKEIKPSVLPSGDEPKVQNLRRKHDYQIGSHQGSTGYCTQTDARSTAEEDSSNRPAARESTLVEKARIRVKLSIKGGNMNTGSYDNGVSLNRKMEWEESPIHLSGDCQSNIHSFQDNTEETSESGSNKQKKVRVPNYEPKQSSTRKGNWNAVSQPTAGIQIRSPMLQADVSGDEPKVQKQQKKPVNQNESHHCSSRFYPQNDHASRDIDLRSSAEKDLPNRSSANESSLVKKPRLRVSFNGGSMEIGNFDKVNSVVAMNREMDCQESKNCLPVARQNNRRSSFQNNKEETNESRINKDKEVRVPKYEGEESTRSRGDGNTVTQPTAGIYVERTPNILPADVSGDEQKVQIQPQIPNSHRSAGYCAKSRYASTDIHTQSSVEIDSPGLSAAKEVINEGYELKHKADHLKKFGSELESTNLSFQAALKFLRGGFLLESFSLEIAKRRDIADSIFIYRETAKLCQPLSSKFIRSVADEYEKRNEMAAAALAYKCMEVAYMRIIAFRDMRISQDQHELRIAYPDTHPGESPSSSVSDVDSLHNQGTLANVSPSKRHNSKSEEDHIIVEEDVPKYERVLDHLEFVDIAMETNRKCRETLAAALGRGESNYAEGLPYVRSAMTCSFSDINAVIRHIQLAIDALMIDN